MLKTLKVVPTDALCQCVILILKGGEIPWSQTGATHYNAQLGLPDKGRAIKR